MQSLNLYTSSPDDVQLAIIVQAVERNALQVIVLPIEALPAPRTERLLALQVERKELLHDKELIIWYLTQYSLGNCLPDACHENGLKADYDATCTRLLAVERSIAALEKGPHSA